MVGRQSDARACKLFPSSDAPLAPFHFSCARFLTTPDSSKSREKYMLAYWWLLMGGGGRTGQIRVKERLLQQLLRASQGDLCRLTRPW